MPDHLPSSAVRGTQAGAAAALLGSLAFISTVVSTGDLSPRESFLLPVGILGSACATIGLALLVIFAPRVLSDLPGWAVATATAALAFTLGLSWLDATAVVGIANETTDSVFDDIGASAGFIAFMAPKSLLGLIGFGGLAVTGLRSGALDRAPAILFGVGALAFVLPPFPPGLVLVSIALLLVARRRVN